MAHRGRLPASCPEVTTLLFDLDGTLVDQLARGLHARMFVRLVRHFRRLIPPWKLRKAFWSGIRAVKTNQTDRINHELFLDTLAAHARGSREELAAHVDRFLTEHLVTVADCFRPIPGARETLELAHGLGYRLVLATNPALPLEAVEQRMRWGNVRDLPWERITSSQSMTRCKPDPGFYRELLAQLEVEGAQCLMVGNDPQKDLPAKDVGCWTYLLDLPQVRKRHPRVEADPRLDGYGSYHDLQEWIRRSAEEACPTPN
jgi:FMN phosphatase YigB (HAD superfamily)